MHNARRSAVTKLAFQVSVDLCSDAQQDLLALPFHLFLGSQQYTTPQTFPLAHAAGGELVRTKAAKSRSPFPSRSCDACLSNPPWQRGSRHLCGLHVRERGTRKRHAPCGAIPSPNDTNDWPVLHTILLEREAGRRTLSWRDPDAGKGSSTRRRWSASQLEASWSNACLTPSTCRPTTWPGEAVSSWQTPVGEIPCL